MKKSNKILINLIVTIFLIFVALSFMARTLMGDDYVSFFNDHINHKLIGNKTSVSKNIPVSEFNALTASGQFIIHLLPNHQQLVTINTDGNLMPNIEVTVHDHTLMIHQKHDMNQRATITIGAKDLQQINLRGKNTLLGNNLQFKHLGLNLEGKNSVTLTGSAENFTINSVGKSEVKAENFLAKIVSVNLQGKSVVSVNALQSLQGQLLGKNRLNYVGAATPTVNALGKNRVTKLK